MRRACAALEEAGLHRARIAAAAAHLARARAALEVVTEAVLARASRPHRRRLCRSIPAALAAAPREVGLRALAALLMAVGGQAYRPRFEALERLFDRMAAGTLGGGVTLHGCRIAPPARGSRDFRAQTLADPAGKTPENRQIRAAKALMPDCARCCGAAVKLLTF